MEPKNDIIKACLNQIDITAHKLLEHWSNSFNKTKYL